MSDKEISIVIWGGRTFIFLSVDDIRRIISGGIEGNPWKVTLAADWILDAAFSPSLKDTSCVFITAHNEAVQVFVQPRHDGSKMKTRSSASRSILYSAHVTWVSDTTIMVAAGTVFGEIEIIVWSMDGNDNTESGIILTTFTGHEGSIFGVQISPELNNGDGTSGRVLASCSDDRTIRLWDLSALDLDIPFSNGISKLSLKDTGFGGKKPSTPVAAQTESRCIAKAMGHASRIWKVRFIVEEDQKANRRTAFNILSFGEDCTVQQWVLNGSPAVTETLVKVGAAAKVGAEKKAPATLNHLGTYANHTGKHIWSTALHGLSHGSTIVATGGADGTVATIEVFVKNGSVLESTEKGSRKLGLESFRSQTYTPAGILEQLGGFTEEPNAPLETVDSPEAVDTQGTAGQKNKKKAKKSPVAKKDVFNKYAFVDSADLLFTTTFGKVVVQQKERSGWQRVSFPAGCEKALRSYSVVASISDGSVLMAGVTGKVLRYRSSSDLEEIASLKGKVAGIFKLPGLVSGYSSALATVLGQTQATIINIEKTQKHTQSTIDLPALFVVTSAGVVDQLVVLGCRSGRIAVYDTSSSPRSIGTIVDKSFDCRDAITSIVPLRTSDEALPHFAVTARNGKYGVFAIHKGRDSQERILELLHYSTLPFGPMIEGASYVDSSLIIYGFRSEHFIVWDETNQREIMSVKCGGAHRNYTFERKANTDAMAVFAYTKASKLCVYEQLQQPFQIVKEGGHGREIKVSAVSHDQQLIATAAEDTNIRIWSYEETHSPLTNKLQCHAVLRKHSAGIQHLQWAEAAGGKSKYLFSAGGAEEFCVWAVSWIPGFGLGVVCEAILNDLSEERDLRIMSFHAVAVGGEEGGESTYLIAIAFSDSTIRAYWYDRSHGFEKLARGRYTSACLTQIHVMPMPSGEAIFLSGSTDGHLQLWQISDEEEELNADVELVMTERVRVHQSAILAFDILPIGQADFIVATGGDDNAAALTCLGPAGFGFRTIIPSAHAAAVNGITFVAHSHNTAENAGTFRFCTVGGDQKVKKWTIAVSAQMDEIGQLVVQKMEWNEVKDEDDVPTTVSDAAGIVTFGGRCSHKHCMVVGNGLEIFEV